MWTIKTKANFSFSKLLKKLPEIIEKSIEDIGNDSAKATKSSIDTIKHGKPLAQMTQIARSYGIYVKGQRVSPTSSKIPLKYTERLYNSIKGSKKGMDIMDYGILHHEGNSTEGVNRPQRKFIEYNMSEKSEKKFYDNLRKGLKK